MKCEGCIPGKSCDNEGNEILQACPISEMAVGFGSIEVPWVCNCCKECYEECQSET